ncbi:RNA polymerase sigma factor, partial [Singulisphaera rosea]
MASARHGVFLRQIHRLFSEGTVSGLSEWQLLARYVSRRDEAAFEALVARHGPMVLGVCRRLLDDPNDVEDAFQAT